MSKQEVLFVVKPMPRKMSVEVIRISPFHNQHSLWIIDWLWDAGVNNFVPIRPNVKFPPWLNWEQRFLPDRESVKNYYRKGWNLGVVGGVQQQSGKFLFIVDDDLPNRILPFPSTFTILTPSGGRHFYYFLSNPQMSDELANKVQALGKCDFRSTGGYVVAPKSYLDCTIRYNKDGRLRELKGGYEPEKPLRGITTL